MRYPQCPRLADCRHGKSARQHRPSHWCTREARLLEQPIKPSPQPPPHPIQLDPLLMQRALVGEELHRPPLLGVELHPVLVPHRLPRLEVALLRLVWVDHSPRPGLTLQSAAVAPQAGSAYGGGCAAQCGQRVNERRQGGGNSLRQDLPFAEGLNELSPACPAVACDIHALPTRSPRARRWSRTHLGSEASHPATSHWT